MIIYANQAAAQDVAAWFAIQTIQKRGLDNMSITVAVKAVSTCVSAGKAVQNQRIQSKIMTNLDDFSGKLDQIDAKVDLVTQKTDALIIRDLLSANLALDDIKAVGVWDSAELLQLENMYRVNTGLPLEGETCGIRNSQIRAMSYFGLFQIGILKGLDDKRLVRYVLHMFETGEKIVWEELFPQFYEAIFSAEVERGIEEAKRKREERKAQLLNSPEVRVLKEYWSQPRHNISGDIFFGLITAGKMVENADIILSGSSVMLRDAEKAIIIREAKKLLESDTN